jgi:alanine dehydrogenase
MLKNMKNGSVIVDVCIDQGGCVETAKPTTHHEPTYIVDGVVHYCVANMPGAVGRTSSQALCNATLPYARKLAGLGLDGFLGIDAGHAAALNTRDGKITNAAVAQAFSDLPAA